MSVPNKRSDALTEAIAAILIQDRFFASLLLDLAEIHETDVTPSGHVVQAACTNGHDIWINPVQFAKYNIRERMGVIVHEVVHIILDHCGRLGLWQSLGVGPDMRPFSYMRFAKAADYVVNALVLHQKNAKGGQKYSLPMGALINPQVTFDDIVDEVYCKIPDDDDEEEGWDHHEAPDPNKAPSKPKIQSAVAKAAELSKMAGQGTGGVQRLIEKLLEPQIDWTEHLRKAMVTMTRGRDSHTWAKPHRRKLATPPHIYMPGRTGWKGPAIALEMDCSGSISDNQSTVFCGELAGILSDIEPSMVYVLMVDDALLGEVLEIDDVNDVSRIKKAVMQGGGTDMGVVYQVIEERELPVELVVIMTDGHTPWPDEVHIPTVVCSTTDQKAPEHVGPTIRVRISE